MRAYARPMHTTNSVAAAMCGSPKPAPFCRFLRGHSWLARSAERAVYLLLLRQPTLARSCWARSCWEAVRHIHCAHMRSHIRSWLLRFGACARSAMPRPAASGALCALARQVPAPGKGDFEQGLLCVARLAGTAKGTRRAEHSADTVAAGPLEWLQPRVRWQAPFTAANRL
jgi:hypothetical protein